MAEEYTIDGRVLTMPIEVRRSQQWFATYLVPAEAAERIVSPTGLEIAEPRPGRALLNLAFQRYEDCDLDVYDEFGVSFLVRRHDAGPATALGRRLEVVRNKTAVYIHQLPVNQTFTLEAGRSIWGFPKFLADFEVSVRDGHATASLRHEGTHVLTFSVRGGGIAMPKPRPVPAYTLIEGTLRVARWQADFQGVRGRLGGAEITLGDHRMADELRSLGLPKRAMLSFRVANFRATFGAATELGRPSRRSDEKETPATAPKHSSS